MLIVTEINGNFGQVTLFRIWIVMEDGKIHTGQVETEFNKAGWCATAASGDSNAGFVWINSRTGWDNVTVCTCIKTPCNSSDNRLENTIYLD